MISIDCETTGIDLHHGAKPFLVTICDEDMVNTCWEWDVDPMTREPSVPRGDLREIQDVIDDADLLILQNPKFDHKALQNIFGGRLRWDWSKVRDTLLAGHLLHSNAKHDLGSMAVEYLGLSIDHYDDELKKCVEECRRWARKNRPEWRIAEKGLPEMPGAKGTVWKLDSWLPRAVANDLETACIPLDTDNECRTVCIDYANGDSAATMALWKVQEPLLRERGLWRLYEERLKVLPVVSAMEERGVTLHHGWLFRHREKLKGESDCLANKCERFAKEKYDYDLQLPRGTRNDSLKVFLFNVLGLPKIELSKKTGEPSISNAVLSRWIDVLEPGERLEFLKDLASKRQMDKDVQDLDGYKRFMLPKGTISHVLHTSYNPTGTDTLRWSSNNPNIHNPSKQKGRSLRGVFGPALGREWWSIDYENLELRIPAYEAGEEDLIKVFDHPDDPPYFGSYHLVVCGLLYPEEFKELGAEEFKKRYKPTYYQWVKNGNFAVIYGAQEETADATYHVEGAYKKVMGRFPRIARLAKEQIGKANRFGYVETIPDKEVDPDRGYPLHCRKGKSKGRGIIDTTLRVIDAVSGGQVSPTIPLNYHVQGTACWIKTRAAVKVHEYLSRQDDCHLIMDVHDELVLDLPRGRNLPMVRKVAWLMKSCGLAVGVPTPVEMTRHEHNWAEGVKYK